MKSSKRLLLLGLAVFGISCFAFGREFLRGGARSGFVFSWIGFVAAGTLTVATRFRRWKTWVSAVALAGLAAPTIALVLISGAEAGFLTSDSELFRRLSAPMAVLWYPGNWVSSFFGMEVRLSDLHLTRRDELYEWLRLVPLNVLVYGLLGVIAQAAVAHSPFPRDGRATP